VSGGGLGELFVKATPEGLDRLTSIIEHNTSDQMTKELSCVETIEPVTPSYRRSGLDAADVLRNSPRGKNGFITRVGLFNFGPDRDQPNLVADLQAVCKRRDITLSTRGYSPSSFTYEAECRTVDDVEALSRIIGVRSIAPMPLIRTIRANQTARQTDIANLEAASQNQDPSQQTVMATLQRINQALLLQLRTQQDANQINANLRHAGA
jgi:hypothetical protein